MEKEFIPYEQSLALKELGFNEPCLGFRKEDGIFEFFGTPDRDNTNTMFGFYPTAPLYQQAFRWFREKYGLYSHVRESLAFDKTLEFVTQINGSYVNHGIEDKPINRFETYEEAELECLKKLIEICQQKSSM